MALCVKTSTNGATFSLGSFKKVRTEHFKDSDDGLNLPQALLPRAQTQRRTSPPRRTGPRSGPPARQRTRGPTAKRGGTPRCTLTSRSATRWWGGSSCCCGRTWCPRRRRTFGHCAQTKRGSAIRARRFTESSLGSWSRWLTWSSRSSCINKNVPSSKIKET